MGFLCMKCHTLVEKKDKNHHFSFVKWASGDILRIYKKSESCISNRKKSNIAIIHTREDFHYES